MRKILEQCPSCGGPLVISEVHCQNCETQVRSQYRPCDFCSLTEEQATFVRLFVQSRGKLNAMEELLGISYPTVSSKLDEIIGRLQAGARRPATAAALPTPVSLRTPIAPAIAVRAPAAPAPPTPPLAPTAPGAAGAVVAGLSREQVLERLSAGAISAADALATLKSLNQHGSAPEAAESVAPAGAAQMASGAGEAVAEQEMY